MTTLRDALNTIRGRFTRHLVPHRLVANMVERLAPTALRRAERLGRDAAALGFDWERACEALDKVREEVGELAELLEPGVVRDDAAIGEELGDLLFAVVNVARKLDVNAEDALRAANQKFERRFAHVLRGLAERGIRPEAASLETMEALWQEAKRAE